MKNFIMAICLFTGIGACAQQIAKSLTSSGGLFIGFYEYKPTDYGLNPAKKYPLIIFLHGIGERGNGTTDLPRILANGIPKNINAGCQMTFTSLAGVQETFLVLSPQLSASYGSWQNAYVDEMLKYAKQNLQIDTNRIYLTGLSLGGGGTWKYASYSLANASQFAAIVPICGTCEYSNMCNIGAANTAVWAFHAMDDGTVPVACTNGAISSLLSCNPAILPLKTLYASGNHWIWDRAYDTAYIWQNPNVYEWLLGQSRSYKVNALPVAKAKPNKIITLPLSDVSLTGGSSYDPDGTINRYIWRIIQNPGGGWIENPSAGNTIAHSLMQGVYQFELTVVDDRSSWSKDTLMVTVNPTSMNVSPIAEAGNDSTIFTGSINVNASSSYDPDGYVAGYKWTQVIGPTAVNLVCANCATSAISNFATGVYGLEVEVTDNIGAKTKDTVFITSANGVQPVNYLYFKGKNLDKNNLLQWATANEFNNDHFELQRGADGSSFETIAKIPGAGTTTSVKEYKYTDINAPENLSFYRVRQVDKDGAYKYSVVIHINNNHSKWSIESYPNPVSDEMVLQMDTKESGKVHIRLINQLGKVVSNKEFQKYSEIINEKINVKELPAGVYFMEISLGSDLKEVRRIVKN